MILFELNRSQQLALMNHSNFYPQQINTFKSQAGEFDAYKKSVKELLFFASDLSEGQKAISEFFDDKIKSIFQSTLHIAHHKKLSPDEYSQLDLTTKLAVFDALIVVWQLKTRWDAVRPFSAIPFAMQVRYLQEKKIVIFLGRHFYQPYFFYCRANLFHLILMPMGLSEWSKLENGKVICQCQIFQSTHLPQRLFVMLILKL